MARLLLLSVCAALGACSDPPPAPRVERVDITNHLGPGGAADDVARTRAGLQSVLSDARDAWTIPVGGRAAWTLEPRAGEALDLSSAGALLVPKGPPAEGRVRLTLKGAGPVEFLFSTEVDLAQSPRAWIPWSLSGIVVREPLTIEMRADWIGAAPAGAENVRAAFELPRIARAAAPARAGAPNVLLITVDTLRPDRLGCYGYARPTSPNLDALAARGVRFESAYSSAPWTLPSYGSLFTGRLPGEHRAGIVTEREALYGTDTDSTSNATEVLRPDLATLAEAFAGGGWSTAMFQNNPYLSRAAGLERGFQRYVSYGSNARNGVDLALAWIEDRKGPWMLVLHLMDPHFPYAPPAPFDQRFAGRDVGTLENWPPDLAALRKERPSDEVARLSSDLYDGEIAFTDAEIGRLLGMLETKGIGKDTIVVLHSDHGEEFWEHGGCDHGHAQHEELLRVPLVVAWPGRVPEGRVVEPRVRALDLYATLLDLAGLPVPEDVESRSLKPLFDAGGDPRQVIAEAVHAGRREMKAILRGPLKLVARGADENRLYSLDDDPAERIDLAPARAQEVETLRRFLSTHHARSKEAAKHARELELDAEARARMGAIGYGGTAAPARRDR